VVFKHNTLLSYSIITNSTNINYLTIYAHILINSLDTIIHTIYSYEYSNK
jgi:hypothetical protein